MAKKKETKKYSGITTKTLKNGETAIMVRFKYQGKTYPLKNLGLVFSILLLVYIPLFHTNECFLLYENLQHIKLHC